MNSTDFSRLKRQKYKMPTFIKTALENAKVLSAYQHRPAYQQNDYIAWITRAKRQETIDKRLQQMLDELARGDVYMKMPYKPKNR